MYINNKVPDYVAARKRKLVIIVDRAEELPAKSNCFVYFSFNGNDYMTPNQPGSKPHWDHKEQIELIYDDSLRNLFKDLKIE
jgi:hypothetical protein